MDEWHNVFQFSLTRSAEIERRLSVVEKQAFNSLSRDQFYKPAPPGRILRGIFQFSLTRSEVGFKRDVLANIIVTFNSLSRDQWIRRSDGVLQRYTFNSLSRDQLYEWLFMKRGLLGGAFNSLSRDQSLIFFLTLLSLILSILSHEISWTRGLSRSPRPLFQFSLTRSEVRLHRRHTLQRRLSILSHEISRV